MSISPLIAFVIATLLAAPATPVQNPNGDPGGWKTDPAWYDGAAEWAVYDASRPIYGKRRTYEATIFTNKQHMDRKTTTKANAPGANTVEVFKHNVSEMIPTDNYTYRLLTTSFATTDTLKPFKVVASTQEDCGATFKRFVIDGNELSAHRFCYFPDAGEDISRYGISADTSFQDLLSLTLRDYPFDARPKPTREISLIPDQTDTHATRTTSGPAIIRYVERVTLELPYGSIDAHHMRVQHRDDGGSTTSDFWFAADTETMRNVMVKYEGPYGVKYELKRLDWWAYWRDPMPK